MDGRPVYLSGKAAANVHEGGPVHRVGRRVAPLAGGLMSVQLWEHEITNVIDEVYGEGSKLFGDILWQIVIGVEFDAGSFLVRELKPNFECFRGGTLDLDDDSELHCHLTFFLLRCPLARRLAS
jgi:hypothetical protein